jgi:hypothetical protein
MRILLSLFLVLTVTGCTSDLPTSDYQGENELSVTTSKKQLEGIWYADFSAPPATWTIDGVEYYDIGQNTGNGKPFEEAIRGRAWFWEEYHETYNEAGDLLLVYTLKGFMTHKWKWHASGTVHEAFGAFSMWEGRHVNGMGTIEFKADGTPVAHGVLRLH